MAYECLHDIEQRMSFEFKEKQRDAIISIVNGNDTFVVLPTGYGKTKIYAHLPEIYDALTNEKATVLVIFPLQALMVDQVNKLNAIGIKAAFLGEAQLEKSVADQVVSGHYSVVFCSPEAALTPGYWRRCLTDGVFHDRLKAVIIDEAHCITQWGGEFRQEYGKLGQLRSVVPNNTTFVTLTATATTTMKSEIMSILEMDPSTTAVVSVLPDRPSIIYMLRKSNKSVHDLEWLVKDLQNYRKNTKKTIVYCRNIVTCRNLFHHFMLALGEISDTLDVRFIAMFHRSTADINKEHVLTEFPKEDTNLRIVFATVAFGMGVDILDVERVIHWGGPRGLEQYSQESGRAGRDGRAALSLIYYSGHDISKGNCTEEVRQYCKSENCLRQTLLAYFKLDDNFKISKPDTLCACCSYCKKECDCGNCTDDNFLSKSVNNDSDEFDSNGEVKRSLSDEQLSLLRDNIMDFKECQMVEQNKLVSELDNTCIDNIVSNSPYIFCADDLVSLGLVNKELADDIVCLIDEI